MARTKMPIKTVNDMRAALIELFRKRYKDRFNPRSDYRLCELWSMDSPPDTLEETGMANRLDDIIGFHLSEEELLIAYDLIDLQTSAIYLFNLMKDGNSPEDSAECVPATKKKIR